MNSKKPTQDSRFVMSNAFTTSFAKWNGKSFGFCSLLCIILIASASVSVAASGWGPMYGKITVVRKPPSTDWVYDPPKKEKGKTTYHKWKRDLSDTLIIRVCGTPGALKVMSASRQFSDRRDEERREVSDSAYCSPKDPKDIHTPLGKKRKGGKKTPGATILETYKGFSDLYQGLGNNPVKDEVRVTLEIKFDKYKLSVSSEDLAKEYSNTEIIRTNPCDGTKEKEIHVRDTGGIGDKQKHSCETRPPEDEPGVIKLERCITINQPRPVPIGFSAERSWGVGFPITNKDDLDNKVKSDGAGPTAEDTFATWDLNWGPCQKENP